MNIRERMSAVLYGGKPDRIPFFGFSELFPRGAFERYLRNNGMGLMVHSSPVVMEMPNVSTTAQKSEIGEEIIYHAPGGDISIENYLGHQRIASPEMWKVRARFFLKEVRDYEPIISMVDDYIWHVDIEEFKLKDRELGDDGLLHVIGPMPSYTESELVMGLERWGYEQYDNPDKFNMLLEALSRRTDALVDKLAAIDYDMIVLLGDISDNISPENYLKYEVPHYERSMRKLHATGKKCGIHAHANLLKRQMKWLGPLKIDFMESYTPPPFSDIEIDELRSVLGEDTAILINFPETIFYKGYEETKKYTIELLKRDPGSRKMLGFSEMGMMGVDSKTRDIFQNGFKAVLDAIEKVS